MSNEPNEMDSYPYQQGRRVEQVEYSASVLAVILCLIIGFIIGIYTYSMFDLILRGWAY